jgi:8-oxo-dGTP pyrophosphatase MutT (NUDIX family)
MYFLRQAKRLAFLIWSRSAAFAYDLFPVWGRLQGVIVIVEDNTLLLAIDRNDNLGLGLPGGIVGRGEALIGALIREVYEETGTSLLICEQLFRFDSDYRFPTTTAVYRGKVAGNLRESWEERPFGVAPQEIEAKTCPPIKPVIEYMQNSRSTAFVSQATIRYHLLMTFGSRPTELPQHWLPSIAHFPHCSRLQKLEHRSRFVPIGPLHLYTLG